MSRRMSKVVSVSFGTMFTLAPKLRARIPSRYDCGYFNLITMVLESGVVIDRIGAFGLTTLAIWLRSPESRVTRSQLKFTSSVSNGRPFTGALLCHVMPGRIFIVRVSRSGDHSQL